MMHPPALPSSPCSKVGHSFVVAFDIRIIRHCEQCTLSYVLSIGDNGRSYWREIPLVENESAIEEIELDKEPIPVPKATKHRKNRRRSIHSVDQEQSN